MKDVEYLAKDDQIKFGNTNYRAISEEKVTSTVRDSLIKNNLIILPVEQEHKREGNLSTVDIKYKIIDIESGESEVIVSSGTGADTQDKGVGKAMTYAYKYLLLRTFAIPTGEDPDKTASAELDRQQNEQANKQPLGETISAKFKQLYGSHFKENTEKEFNEWYGKKVAEGQSHKQMDTFLLGKIKEADKNV